MGGGGQKRSKFLIARWEAAGFLFAENIVGTTGGGGQKRSKFLIARWEAADRGGAGITLVQREAADRYKEKITAIVNAKPC